MKHSSEWLLGVITLAFRIFLVCVGAASIGAICFILLFVKF